MFKECTGTKKLYTLLFQVGFGLEIFFLFVYFFACWSFYTWTIIWNRLHTLMFGNAFKGFFFFFFIRFCLFKFNLFFLSVIFPPCDLLNLLDFFLPLCIYVRVFLKNFPCCCFYLFFLSGGSLASVSFGPCLSSELRRFLFKWKNVALSNWGSDKERKRGTVDECLTFLLSHFILYLFSPQ